MRWEKFFEHTFLLSCEYIRTILLNTPYIYTQLGWINIVHSRADKMTLLKHNSSNTHFQLELESLQIHYVFQFLLENENFLFNKSETSRKWNPEDLNRLNFRDTCLYLKLNKNIKSNIILNRVYVSYKINIFT